MATFGRTRFPLFILALFLAIAATSLWLSRDKGSDAWFSSPTAQRPKTSISGYERQAPWPGIRTLPSDDFRESIKKSGESFHLVSVGEPGKWYGPKGMIWADEDQVAQLPSGLRLRLVAIGVMVMTEAKASVIDSQDEIPYDFYDPVSLEPLKADLMKRYYSEDALRVTSRSDKMRMPTPIQLALDFEVEGGPEPHVYHIPMIWNEVNGDFVGVGDRFRVRNALREIVDKDRPGMVRFRMDLTQYHVAAVTVELVVSSPPRITVIDSLEEGTEFPIGPAKGKVLFHLPKYRWAHNWSALLPLEDPRFPEWPNDSLMIALDRELDVRIILLDEGGNEYKHTGVQNLGRSGRNCAWFEQTEFQATSARFEWIPHYSNVLFTLPRIPGIPPENEGLEDLFDVRIPFAEISSSKEFHWMICSASQTRFHDVRGERGEADLPQTQFPRGYFPRSFVDVTVRELLDEYQEHMVSRRVWTDRSHPTRIYYRSRPYNSWGERLAEWWQGLW